MNLAPFKLERFFARYEFNVQYVLCGSDCESVSVGDLLAVEPGAEEGLKGLRLGYTESLGAPSLREEISRIYASMGPGEILVHSGAEEAIFLFMHAALRPGDHVIVHWPCYQSLAEVARSIGCDVTLWEAHAGNGWRLDLDELADSFRSSTRALIVNTPHNPTGHLMFASDYRALLGMAADRGITVFSDEVYRELEYNPAERLPSACDVSPDAVSLGVMSKAYGLAGLRIGWVATRNARLRERMAALKDYTTICSSAPSEYLAKLALRHREMLVRRNLQIIRDNLSLLDSFLERHADRFTWTRPRAGSIAFPRLSGEDVEAFCHRLVTTSGVLLLPGTMYDHPGNHFRIGFARKNMPQALARLEEFLEKK